jgi:TPR repeat protein
MPKNSDFENYVKGLKQLDSEDNHAELENMYTLNSAVLQFFKGIDKPVLDLLNKSTVTPVAVKQIESALPALTKLKAGISKLDANSFASGYIAKINQMVANIKNDMTLSEVDVMSQKFFELIKENEAEVIREQIEKEREEADKMGFDNIENYRKFKILLKKAEQGDAEAQYKVGICYETKNDYGVKENEKESFKWFLKAANQGHLDAQYEIGGFYSYGYGVAKNETECFKWWLKASSQGHAMACYYLGHEYYNKKNY